ncbi:MAG: hypothetical protein PHI12_07470 [Dehalococcoidales bacterium]|nr:hypothetical protein [Dehalococcoidales bacterium]
MSSLPCHCTKCPKTWDYYDEKENGSDKMSIVQYQGLICPQCGAAGVAGAGVEKTHHEPIPLETVPISFERSETKGIDGKLPEGTIIVPSPIAPVPGTAIIKVNPEADDVFQEMKKEALRLLEWGKVRVIDNPKDEKSATEDLGSVATLLKKLAAAQKEWTAPTKTNLELVAGAFNDVIKPLQEIDKTLREKVSAYRAEVKRQTAILQEANRIVIENARKEAAANNGEVLTPIVINTVPAAPQKTVRTATGTASETENWDFKIVNFDLLPEKYKIHSADVVKIRKDVVKNKGTLEIPGVEQFKKEGLRITTPRGG